VKNDITTLSNEVTALKREVVKLQSLYRDLKDEYDEIYEQVVRMQDFLKDTDFIGFEPDPEFDA